MQQIQALIQLSDRCEQEITFGCFLAPLQDEGVNFGWWEDKYGDANYYYSGDNVGKHTCSCGKITFKTLLPELNFDLSFIVFKERLELVLTLTFRTSYVIVMRRIPHGTLTKVRLQPRKSFQ